MKRLLPRKLTKPRRPVTVTTLDRSARGSGWQQQQPTGKLTSQKRTKVTTSSLSCTCTATRSKLNSSVQLRPRPAGVLERGIFGASSDRPEGSHSNICLLACAAAAAAAVAVVDRRRADATSWEGRKFEDVYDLAEKAPPLGSGSYGTVSAAVHKATGEVVAVKRIPRSKDMTLKEINAEVEVLKVAGEHRNITQFYELFVDDDYYYLTMELAKGGELFDYLLDRGIPTEAQTAVLMKALIGAVAYVHMHGIIHGDIKPENVFFTAMDGGEVDWEGVLLGDFGSAVEVASGGRTTLSAKETRVTVAYSPPETLRAALDGNELTVSPGGDVWALGVLMYMLLTGEHPFAPDMSVSDEDIADNVMQDGHSGDGIPYTPYFLQDLPPIKDDHRKRSKVRLPPLARDLLSKMLNRNTAERPSAQEILQHPWFRRAEADLDRANATVSGGLQHAASGDGVLFPPIPVPAASEALQVFWSGRRRLKGCLLAVMAGLVDGISQESNGVEGKEAGEVQGGFHQQMQRRRPSLGKGGDLERKLPSGGEAVGQDVALGSSSTARYDKYTAPLGASEEFIGSRTVACRMIDRGGKGYITADDLVHVMRLMGEDVDASEEVVSEMMKAVDGDPSTESRRVTYEQMARLVPPLCPARKFKAGQELYKEGDLDPTFYLLRKGVVEFSVTTPGGKVPLQTQGPGASFGEVELLRADGSTAPRLATCRCLGRPGSAEGECEALVVRGHLFSLLTDVFTGVRARLGTQAEDRLTQLAGSVLQNGFHGYEQSVAGREVVWNNTDLIKRDENETRPFALLVLEGSVTALFGQKVDGEDSENGGGANAEREQVLGPGQFCFCGEGQSFGPGAPEAPRVVTCRPWQTARVLRVPAAEFRALMAKRNMAALTEFMLDQ